MIVVEKPFGSGCYCPAFADGRSDRPICGEQNGFVVSQSGV
jgi:hypothetical protein